MPLGPIVPGSYVSATPDANPAPSTSLTIAPSATRPVIGADLQNFELAMLNEVNSSVVNEAALTAMTAATDGMRVFSKQYGWYRASFAGAPVTADGFWILAATIVGQPLALWFHSMWNMVIAQRVPSIGPVPGETTTNPTSAGRINGQFIPFGFFTSVLLVATQFNTNDATNVSNTTGHVFETITVGTLAAGDYVFAHLSGVGFNLTGGFQIGTYISFDNGANYAIVSPDSGGGSAYTYAQTGAGVAVAVAVSFVKPASAGICKVQFRGSAPGGGTTFFTRSAGFIEVKRV